MVQHRIGTPEEWAAIAVDQEASAIARKLERVDARAATLKEQADALVLQMKAARDRGTKARLVAQSLRIQRQAKDIAAENEELQRQAAACQRRLVEESNGAVVG